MTAVSVHRQRHCDGANDRNARLHHHQYDRHEQRHQWHCLRPSSGSPSANGVIDHVVANSNGSYGIFINTDATSGGTTIVSVSNSIASGNTVGIFVDNSSSPSTSKALIDNLYATANNTGVEVSGTANVLLGRSVISANTIGVGDNTSPNTLYTSGDNRIDLNASASITPIGTQLVAAPPQ